MKETTEKQTVPEPFVGANAEQPASKDKDIITSKVNSVKCTNNGANRPEIKSPAAPIKIFSMEELFDTAYPANTPVIEDILYNGTYLFVGTPKVGKSFLMAQIGYHVSHGIPLWGHPVTQGAVLYLALEDTEARIQRRLSKMFDIEVSKEFYFATEAATLATGLDGQLDYFLRNYHNPRLIIIDTLQMIREIGGEKFSYADDYEVVAKIKAFGDRHNICIVIVHHTRKQGASDCFEKISGTNGLLGAADGAFLIMKDKRTGNGATIEIVGRDQPDQKLYVEFDREKCVWNFVKNEVELWEEPTDPLLEKLNQALQEKEIPWTGSATELLELISIEGLTSNVLTRKLNVSVDRLRTEYGFLYQNRHERTGSIITFDKAAVTECDDVTITEVTDKPPEISSQPSLPSPGKEAVADEACTDQ